MSFTQPEVRSRSRITLRTRNMATAIDGPDYALMERCNVRFEDASKSCVRATKLLQQLATP